LPPPPPPKTHTVKQRIRAIKNIGKITKAMKMVAASKMRNAQVAVENSRGVVEPFVRLFGDFPAYDPTRTVTVAVTSDRGLCGGLNSSITKYTRALLKMYTGSAGSAGAGGGEGAPASSAGGGVQQTVVTIGDKGRSQLSRVEPELLALSFADTYKTRVTFAQASVLAEEVLKASAWAPGAGGGAAAAGGGGAPAAGGAAAPPPDAVRVLFNKFGSAISFKPTVATILSPAAVERQMTTDTGSKLDAYELEAAGEKADALQDLVELQLAATLFNAMLENNCSEHGSRMSAMENSTKSAGEMLGALTLKYNRDRQATITTELIEIIAGASALMDS
jgi:F-type H+-transporting ATPase subunit gamma